MMTRLPLRAISSSGVPRAVSRASLRCVNRVGAQIPLLERSYVNATTSPVPENSPRESPFNRQPPPQQPKTKRSLRPYIYATTFAFIGALFGQYVNLMIAPPALPEPGSHEDKLMVEHLIKSAEKLPLVQSLMSDPNWVYHDAYGGFDDKEKDRRLTTGAMSGARGIGGFQRVFYNADTGEHVTVVWIGGALAGWPGVTHGGVTATLMDETLGRCAIRLFPGQTGVTANLELNYLKPLITNAFYVLRSMPQKEGSTDRKQYVSGRVETLDGRVCAEAKALFVVPKKFTTPSVRI